MTESGDPVRGLVHEAGLPCTEAEIAELSEVRRWSRAVGAELDVELRHTPQLRPVSRELLWSQSTVQPTSIGTGAS